MRVLLPNRPNRSTGWIHIGSGGVQWSRSDYKIYVSLRMRRIAVYKSGRRLGVWPVAIGAPNTPTPAGRTFVMAAVDTGHGYGVPVLPLGMHSNALRTFNGGPATIGLHGWPDSGVFGHNVSNGCVRVPKATLAVLRHVPLGTMVTIR
ncbi:L,D-transpeptidase [Acrocarpospora corrugata]|uniref:L,D-transpeptidase n=1 Tax=Acrocarpospora corrugata TaxID=35763 RepID=UPI001478FB35|nr:L,D-transpeptidase [Acrocarpospora corrugata]